MAAALVDRARGAINNVAIAVGVRRPFWRPYTLCPAAAMSQRVLKRPAFQVQARGFLLVDMLHPHRVLLEGGLA
jgi:hypothetical protein